MFPLPICVDKHLNRSNKDIFTLPFQIWANVNLATITVSEWKYVILYLICMG